LQAKIQPSGAPEARGPPRPSLPGASSATARVAAR